MPNFTESSYEPPDVDRAGDSFVYADTGIDEGWAIGVVNDWRQAHAYPLNTFQMTLRRRGPSVDPDCVVAQRQKRLSSIISKLEEYPELKLSEVQDIAGCRVIVSTVEQVYRLVHKYRQGYSTHRLDGYKDYIRRPKSDGYRGYHLIYKHYSPKAPSWDGLKVEMQFRTASQHSWATAVETVDFFLRQGLKRHKGSDEWKRFFALTSSYVALKEGYRRVPRTPNSIEAIADELRPLTEELRVFERLDAFQQTLTATESTDVKKIGIKHVALVLDQSTSEPSLNLSGFRARQFQEAVQFVQTQEQTAGVDAVLVSVAGTADFRRAYPNYYWDTSEFLQTVRGAIS